MPNHEWRLLPILNSLSESSAELVFLIAHIPFFALAIAFVASTHQRTRLLAQRIASGFLILHGALHLAFLGQADYEFSSTLSSALIYGAALCGIAYFLVATFEGDQ